MKRLLRYLRRALFFDAVEVRGPQCYRGVVKSEPHPQGELVTLACGHQVLIQRHRIASVPCEACVEDNQRKPRGPQVSAGGNA